MHMQAKGTTDYKSGFTFAFEQLLNVRANKLFREGCMFVCGLGIVRLQKVFDNMLELCTIAPACHYTSCQGYCLIQFIKLN